MMPSPSDCFRVYCECTYLQDVCLAAVSVSVADVSVCLCVYVFVSMSVCSTITASRTYQLAVDVCATVTLTAVI